MRKGKEEQSKEEGLAGGHGGGATEENERSKKDGPSLPPCLSPPFLCIHLNQRVHRVMPDTGYTLIMRSSTSPDYKVSFSGENLLVSSRNFQR